MPNETRVYRYPIFTRIILFLGSIAFSAVAVLSAFEKIDTTAFYCFTPFSLLSLYVFVSCIYTLKIDEVEIASTHFFRTQSLAWHEVSKITPKGDSFVLMNHGGDVRVLVNSQVVGFIEAVGLINQKKPDLWELVDIKEFHVSLTGVIILGGCGMLMIIPSVISVFEQNEEIIPAVFLILMGLVGLGGALFAPIKLVLDKENLFVKSLVRNRRVNVSEIESIGIQQKVNEHAFIYPVSLNLANKKSIVIMNLKEGSLAFTNALHKWMEKYRIAPK